MTRGGNASHTPGPWYAVARMVEIGNDDAPDICSTDPYTFGQGHLARCIEEAEANSHLIAAAPDLLAALVALLADYEALAQSEGFWEYEHLTEYLAARAAIARATGAA